MSAYDTYPAPVHAAVAAGKSAEQVRRVIERLAQGSAELRVQAVNRDETPLEAAIRLERPDLVGLLLEAGADAKRLEGACTTPLAVCAAYGTTESLRALLRAGHDANERVPYLQRGRVNPDPDYPCAAAHLCLVPSTPEAWPPSQRPPRLEALEVLVTEGGADVDARDEWGRTPLMWLPYAACDHEAALDLLLRLGADVNARSWSRRGDPLSDPNESPLIVLLANYRGRAGSLLPCVRGLVARGARTSGVFDRYGRSPLAMAAAKGHAAVVRFLLEEARVPVNERDPNIKRTALHFCRCDGHGDVMTMLLDAGADVAARDSQGETPIFATTTAQDYGPIGLRLLLERGGSPDVFDSKNVTPLIAACTNWCDGWPFLESVTMVELLFRVSSPETRNAVRADGYSAIDCICLGLREQLDIDMNIDMQYMVDNDPSPTELYDSMKPDQRRVIAEMLAAGVPFLPEFDYTLLQLAVERLAPRAERAAVEMAARCSQNRRWRAHEDMVALALDAKEAREAKAEVEAAERRLLALERRLRELRDVEEEEGEEGEEATGGGGQRAAAAAAAAQPGE